MRMADDYRRGRAIPIRDIQHPLQDQIPAVKSNLSGFYRNFLAAKFILLYMVYNLRLFF
jgi:hypothetical protein